MKFSENWLRELVAIDADRATLMHRLTMAGLEVEDVTALGESLDGVVVGEIVAAEKHPDADRLQICSVDVGGDTLAIVCGAPNARVGLKAPLATVGATLPGGTTIKAARLRGVASSGMLCSARELGVDADASGLMELPADAPTGAPLAAVLGLPDASIELSLTPNRPDCLGLHGLAHDVAALFDSSVADVAHEDVPAATQASRGIVLDAGADCPRYLGRIIENIDVSAPTPLWMAERLRRAGLHPISIVVDVTNYVMLELGQPLHAFDNDVLEGDVVVRHARAGETLTLLDDSEAALDPGFLLIADAARPLAVAGVMGGMASRVTDTTRHVFLESAHFAPAAIMGRARKLGLHTDASHRFERGVDPALPQRALQRATALLIDIAGGQAGPVLSAERPADVPQNHPVPLRRARLSRVLGIDIADADVERMLTALDMQVRGTAEGWRVTAPSRRFDIAREEDLIEEVARIHGYDRIPVCAPGGSVRLVPQPEAKRPQVLLREQLAARDYHEAICMAFVAADTLDTWGWTTDLVPLANPLSADLAVMRPSLLPGLVDAAAHNLARQQERVRLFEVGRRFVAGQDAPLETPTLAMVAVGAAAREQWGASARAMDFHDLKGDLESLFDALADPVPWQFDARDLPGWLHPGRAARVMHNGHCVGHVGALHPRLLAALDIDQDIYAGEVNLEPLLNRRVPRAAPVSRFPSVRRDLAVELPDETTWARVESSVRAALGPRLATLRLFDRYVGEHVGEGRKSLAMGLILQDESRTLTDQDADACVADAVAALERDCRATLRG